MRFFVVLLASCAARTDLGGHSDASSPPATQVEGVVVDSCAPNDGPAIDFELALPTAPVVPACPSPMISAPSVSIQMWGPSGQLPAGPGVYAIGSGSFASGSIAVYCPAEGQCVTADHGSLTLTNFQGDIASGSFTLVMADQTTVSGNFSQIPFCHEKIICG